MRLIAAKTGLYILYALQWNLLAVAASKRMHFSPREACVHWASLRTGPLCALGLSAHWASLRTGRDAEKNPLQCSANTCAKVHSRKNDFCLFKLLALLSFPFRQGSSGGQKGRALTAHNFGKKHANFYCWNTKEAEQPRSHSRAEKSHSPPEVKKVTSEEL